MKYKKLIPILIVIILAGIVILGYQKYQEKLQVAAIEAQQEAEQAAQKLQEDKNNKRKEELILKADKISSALNEVGSDEGVCDNLEEAVAGAQTAAASCEAFRQDCKTDVDEVKADGLEIIAQVETKVQDIIRIQSVEDMLGQLYNTKTDTVVMNTGKNSKLFQDFQQEMWKIPLDYPKKLQIYETAVQRISQEWNYVNDEWNYESNTLKVSVEEKQTSYTKYWVAHIQTFSTDQLRSALCGGTYGNPRRTTSAEVADHNGVIGINGSGFAYGSGIPAPGKSMIKEGEVYSDVYSNGNIMCVTSDGGMFTAVAGMTTEDMLNRGVRDTYCFGPTLVEEGKAYEITAAFQQTYRYQRSAVGMVSPGDYYIVVVDGKGSGGSQGMTYEEIQQVFLDLNCQYAYNMDGGGSTTLVFKGRVLNALTDGNERPCADILYFIDAGDGGEGDEIIVHEDEAMLQP